MNVQAVALGTGEGEALWTVGSLVVFKATAEQTGGRFVLVEQLAPGGLATPLHRQPEDEESFYVLEGEMTFYLGDGEPISASAGAFVHVPKGERHAFQVDSEEARFLDLSTPQHERFYRAAGGPAQASTPPPSMDMDKVAAAAERFGVEILGPPPGAAG